jgi:four helix bundle protein
MLRVYQETLAMIRGLRATVAAIEARDGDLGRQMRRAMASVALNIAEGQGSRGGNQRLRFATALGSMRETQACIDVAAAFRHASVDAEMARQLDAICGSLYRLSR